jgi:hypothetical protein
MPQQVRDAALRATPFPLMRNSLYRKRRRSRRFSRAADEVARPWRVSLLLLQLPYAL